MKFKAYDELTKSSRVNNYEPKLMETYHEIRTLKNLLYSRIKSLEMRLRKRKQKEMVDIDLKP